MHSGNSTASTSIDQSNEIRVSQFSFPLSICFFMLLMYLKCMECNLKIALIEGVTATQPFLHLMTAVKCNI